VGKVAFAELFEDGNHRESRAIVPVFSTARHQFEKLLEGAGEVAASSVGACQGPAGVEVVLVPVQSRTRGCLAAERLGVHRKLHPATKRWDSFCGVTSHIDGIENAVHFAGLAPVQKGSRQAEQGAVSHLRTVGHATKELLRLRGLAGA